MRSRISRRRFLEAGAATAAACVGSSSVPLGAEARPPNIVMILMDQLTERAIGLHGAAAAHTPSMDRLARAGTSFVASYCADPTCCPARAALFTGRYAGETGVLINGLPLRRALPDIGGWLKEHSEYETLHFGKWHIPGRGLHPSFTVMASYARKGEHCDLPLARAFEGFLASRTEERPFFAVVSLYNPHDIVGIVSEARKGVEHELVDPYPVLPPLPPNTAVPSGESALFKKHKRGRAEEQWDAHRWQLYRWWYDRQVETVDGVVGRIMDLAWASPRGQETVIILTADHGDSQGEHHLVNKQALYEAAVKVPMMIAWPGRLPARGVDRRYLVSSVDVFPTICELARIAPPEALRGYSFLPAARGEDVQRPPVFAQSLVEGRMLRTPRHKYVSFRGDSAEQLFDLEADPWEQTNLAATPEGAALLPALRQQLAAIDADLDEPPLAAEGYAAVLKELKRQKKAAREAARAEQADEERNEDEDEDESAGGD